MLDLLNGPEAGITAEALAPHFSVAFLRQVPAATLAELLRSIARQDAPLALRELERSSDASLTAIVASRDALMTRIQLVVAGAPPVIGGLLLQPAPDRDPNLGDYPTVFARMAAVAPKVRALVARIDGATCTPLHARAADEAMPLGSLFKIYVLGAVAAKVAAGEVGWDDLVAIRDEQKSLPSGDLRNAPAGSKLSVRDMATAMIAESDNTATDHLLHLVGRVRVEAAQGEMGHTMPALNVPFLSTRDLFVLKLGASAEERGAYLAAARDERRRLLDEDYAKRPLPALESALDWIAPRQIEELEWFASPADVCRGFAALNQRAATPAGAPLVGVLAKNPGVPFDKQALSYVGFKGGSEPGVLAAGWLVRRAVDGVWLNVTVGFADAAKPIDEDRAIYFAMAALQLADK